MRWGPLLLFLALMLLMACPGSVQPKKLFDIHWNGTNSIFRIDNTDHIIDVNKGNNPFEYDQVNIICPVYTPGTKEEDIERYIIYNVSKEEYDSCRITNPNPRIIAVCDKPHQVMYFTITFRSFTPQPGGLEFRPGQDYYFISTSTGGLNGLNQRIGGRCATHNMKVIFKVCCDPSKMPSTSSTSSSTASSSTAVVPTQRPSLTSTRMPTAGSRDVISPKVLPPSTSSSVPPFWLKPPTRTPPYKTYEVPHVIDGTHKKNNKKSEERDKLPNETRAKNEELVNNSSGAPRRRAPWVLAALLTLMALRPPRPEAR